MAGVNGGFRHEGVRVDYLPADARDEQVAALDRPWIAEEGPLGVRFVRLGSGDLPELHLPELHRGLAFDHEKTVTWDESAVAVITPEPPDGATLALESDVLVREKFPDAPSLVRVDYIKDGVWQGSRYLVKGGDHA